jgi:hypothetical protein
MLRFAYITAIVLICAASRLMSAVESVQSPSAADSTAQQTSPHDNLIEEFVQRLIALDEQRKKSELAKEEDEAEYTRFLSDEAERLAQHLPSVLFSLQHWLGRRSSEEIEFDELVSRMSESADYDAAWEYMQENEGKTRSVPRCALSHLMGYLGRSDPATAVGALLDALPMPERGEDYCVSGVLRMLGPAAYEPLTDRLLARRSLIELHIGAIALLAQSQNTEFPRVAGLGELEEVDDKVFSSKRKLVALIKKWKKWWSESGEEYSWNPQSELLY